MNNEQLSPEKIYIEDKELKLKKALKDKLLNIGYNFSNVVVKYIGTNIFAIGYEDKIGFYCDSKGDNYFNLKGLASNYYFKKASILAGYTERKREDGVYEMYKIKGINKRGNNIDIKLGEKLDKYSLENFQAWQDINFFEIILLIKTIYKNTEGLLKNLDSNSFIILSRSGALRIKDIEKLKKQGQITEEIFQKTLKLYQTKEDNLLLQQVGDERFERVDEGITKKEIEDYYSKGYISEDLYYLALEKIQDLESLETRKQSEIQKHIGEEKKAIRDL